MIMNYLIIIINIHPSFHLRLEGDILQGYLSNSSGKVIEYNSSLKQIKFLKIKGEFQLNEKIIISNEAIKATYKKSIRKKYQFCLD